MAYIEKVKFHPADPTKTTEIINLSASVGARGVNNHNDVIVVQALLKYALQGRNGFLHEEFPEPCGVFIKSTTRSIRKFQRFINRSSHVADKVKVDGRIDPIKNGSAYVFGTRRTWTLYSLVLEAKGRAWLETNNDYDFEALFQRWSFLRGILNQNKQRVGTLGLSLE